MRAAVALAFAAMLTPGCSALQPRLQQTVRAPAGWEPFCFPAPIAFLRGSDRISPGTRRMLAGIYEIHLHRNRWLMMTVLADSDEAGPGARALAHRRARAALRLLRRLGTPSDRVALDIVDEGKIVRDDRDIDGSTLREAAKLEVETAVYVVGMIPPEEVERNRAEIRANPKLVFC